MRAAFMGDLEMVQFLLSHGADASLVDSDAESALFKAASRGFRDVAALLESACPAMRTMPTKRGQTADVFLS